MLAELPALAEDVVAALQTIAAVLPQLVTAAERYDEFVATSLRHLEKVAPNIEPTYVGAEGLNLRPRSGTAASPFVAGADTPTTDQESAPVQRSRFKAPRHRIATVDGSLFQAVVDLASWLRYCSRP